MGTEIFDKYIEDMQFNHAVEKLKTKEERIAFCKKFLDENDAMPKAGLGFRAYMCPTYRDHGAYHELVARYSVHESEMDVRGRDPHFLKLIEEELMIRLVEEVHKRKLFTITSNQDFKTNTRDFEVRITVADRGDR